MPETVHLELPQPPSVNDYWIRAKGRRALTISAVGRTYKEAIWMLTGRYRRAAGGAGKTLPVFVDELLRVVVEWHRRLGRNGQRQGDLDNRLKVLLDALQYSVYTSDAQIVDLRIFRPVTEAGDGGRILVDVSAVACEIP